MIIFKIKSVSYADRVSGNSDFACYLLVSGFASHGHPNTENPPTLKLQFRKKTHLATLPCLATFTLPNTVQAKNYRNRSEQKNKVTFAIEASWYNSVRRRAVVIVRFRSHRWFASWGHRFVSRCVVSPMKLIVQTCSSVFNDKNHVIRGLETK